MSVATYLGKSLPRGLTGELCGTKVSPREAAIPLALFSLLKLLSQDVCGHPRGYYLSLGVSNICLWGVGAVVFLVIRVVGVRVGDQYEKNHGPCGADCKTIHFRWGGLSCDYR